MKRNVCTLPRTADKLTMQEIAHSAALSQAPQALSSSTSFNLSFTHMVLHYKTKGILARIGIPTTQVECIRKTEG